jgi:uncharacterized protein YutE (UPF0331/DUF86 family)
MSATRCCAPQWSGSSRSSAKSCGALAQLAKLDQALSGQITEYRRIIAFRNILIHGYAEGDDRLVWDVVETNLPFLRDEVAGLLAAE